MHQCQQKIRRRVFFFWAGRVAVCAVLGLAAGCDRAASVADRLEAAAVAAVDSVDNDREPVRQWLRDNTPTGKWEEIKWSDESEHKGWKIVELKYRTENPLGGMWVREEVFYVKDGEARQRNEMPAEFWSKEK